MKTIPVSLKLYSLTELSGLYQVCTRTMKKWMLPFDKEIGDKHPGKRTGSADGEV